MVRIMSSKRFNIISSAILIIVLGASLGAGIGIGFANKKAPDFITFHFNNNFLKGS